MNNILFPTDFSGHANNAFRFAAELATTSGAHLHVLNVYKPPKMAPMQPAAWDDRSNITDNLQEKVNRDVKAQAEKKMEEMFDAVVLDTINHTVDAVEGNIQSNIHKLIAEYNADVVVMGTEGEEAQHGLFGHSITVDVIPKAKCPILAIPAGCQFNGINKIAYATDLVKEDKFRLRQIASIAKQLDAELIFFHVKTDPSDEHNFSELAKWTEYDKVSYREIFDTDVEQGIFDFCSENDIDVLSMTTHTTTLFERLFHKSVTREVALHTHLPLLAFSEES